MLAQHCEASIWHLRIDNGRHEVDFVLKDDGRVVAVEARVSPNVSDRDVRHLRWLGDRSETGSDAVVLTTGSAPTAGQTVWPSCRWRCWVREGPPSTPRQAQDDKWGRLRDPARPAQPRCRLFG